MKIKLHHPILILFFNIFKFFGKLIPLKILPFFGILIGKISYLLLKEKRKIIYENIKNSFPNWKDEKIKKCVEENFNHYGVTFFELFKTKKLIKRVEIEGAEDLRKGPSILITGHIGNWELMAQVLGSLKVPLYAIAKETYISSFSKFLINLRKRGGVETILRGSFESSKLMLKAIREEKILGFLIDQDTKVDSVFVPFFSRPASTPIGPAELAIKKEIPVFFGYLIRKGNLKYSLKIKRLEIKTKDARELTYKMTSEIEKVIRMYPTQWVWVHRRWKTTPINSNH